MHHLLSITHAVAFNRMYANKYLLGTLKLKAEAGHKLIRGCKTTCLSMDGYLNKIAGSFKILIHLSIHKPF